jgi:hypothetical protein
MVHYSLLHRRLQQQSNGKRYDALMLQRCCERRRAKHNHSPDASDALQLCGRALLLLQLAQHVHLLRQLQEQRACTRTTPQAEASPALRCRQRLASARPRISMRCE